jgi:hypothetical protein
LPVLKKDLQRSNFMYEHRSEPLIAFEAFLVRLLRHAAVAFGLVLGSLAIGVLGYRFFEGLPWIDALVNASMLLGGMGPVNELHTVGGKLFASFYALYSGLIFLVIAAVLFAPVFHRVLHRFHLELDSDDADKS